MKYFKKIDYLCLGVYISALAWSIHVDPVYAALLGFALFQIFPLMYLLRKHGYLDMRDELGLDATDKAEELADELFVQPVKKFLANKKWVTNLVLIIVLSLLVMFLSYWLFPKILGFPSLSEIY